MNKIYAHYYKTKLGELILGSIDDQLCLCDWRYRKMRISIDNRLKKEFNAVYEENETDTIKRAEKQIEEYIAGTRKVFDIPLKTAGTDFQKKVWKELLQLSYGQKESYGGISRKISMNTAVRAVSSAIGANALSLFIPCHRVIGSKGELTGYAGGLNVKKKLLKLESVNI